MNEWRDGGMNACIWDRPCVVVVSIIIIMIVITVSMSVMY